LPPALTLVFNVFVEPNAPPPTSSVFPYTTLFRSSRQQQRGSHRDASGTGRHRVDGIAPNAAGRGGEATGAAPDEDGGAGFPARQIGRDTSELQSRENLVCRLLLEKKTVQVRRVES